MSYIQSNQIQVFPTTRRKKKQQDARLMTEKALVGIINQLVDKDAFIVTKKSDVASNSPFSFNIRGYYFYVPQLSYITNLFNTDTSNTYIYASITLDDGNGFTELLGQDDTLSGTDYYNGVNFTISSNSSGPTGTNVYSLRILERSIVNGVPTTWKCPDEGFYKYSGSNVDITIDGGIIS